MLPLDSLAETKGERRLLTRLMVVVGAIGVGFLGHKGIAAFADDRIRGVEERVGVVEKVLSEHLTAQAAETKALREFLDRQDKRARQSARKLDALCRVSPRAGCPLGEEGE